jgi:hypothetical protein
MPHDDEPQTCNRREACRTAIRWLALAGIGGGTAALAVRGGASGAACPGANACGACPAWDTCTLPQAAARSDLPNAQKPSNNHLGISGSPPSPPAPFPRAGEGST